VHDGAGDVPRARHAVTSALRDDAVRTDLDAVELIVTELLTNALLHGTAPVSVRACTDHDHVVRVEVNDGAADVPHRTEAGPTSETGRGLLLVSALASRWGVMPTVSGKTVWAEIDGEQNQTRHPSIAVPERDPAPTPTAHETGSASHRSSTSHATGRRPATASSPVGQSRTTSQ
jgi:hypothetical protein